VDEAGRRVSTRRRYSYTLDEEQADVLDALALLNGYTGRGGAWVADQIRRFLATKADDPDVVDLLEARRKFRAEHRIVGRPTRHRFGVIDGGAAQ
jgi:hypothetical protein